MVSETKSKLKKVKQESPEPVVQLRHEFTIVSERNEIVATATVEWINQCYWVSNVWVHADHRRKGYGTKLMKAVIYEFGHADIWLGIHPFTNRPMSEEQLASWYARFGFERKSTPGSMVRRAVNDI